MVLFALIGCEFKVDEYTPPTGITVTADNVPLVDDFLFFNRQLSDTRTFNAAVSGGSNVVITWEITNGTDNVQLLQNQGATVTIKALEPGAAGITVTAENPDGTFEKFFDILVGDDGSMEWTFRIYDNGPNGLTEITGKELVTIFDEEKIIELRTAGNTGGTVNFTVTSDAPSVSIYELQAGSYAVFGGDERGTFPVSVTAVRGVEPPSVKTFNLRQRGWRPIPPLQWDSSSEPAATLGASSAGAARPVTGSPYYLRGCSYTVPAVNGAYVLGGSVSPRLILGSGDWPAPNVSSTGTTASLHVPGQLNLSHDATYRFTIDYRDAVEGDPGRYLLRVSINNNMYTETDSHLGAASCLIHFDTLEQLESGQGYGVVNPNIDTTGSVPGKLIVSFNPVLVYAGNPAIADLETAFISLIAFTPVPLSITITGFSLEELED